MSAERNKVSFGGAILAVVTSCTLNKDYRKSRSVFEECLVLGLRMRSSLSTFDITQPASCQSASREPLAFST